jgi:hypothetical protein
VTDHDRRLVSDLDRELLAVNDLGRLPNLARDPQVPIRAQRRCMSHNGHDSILAPGRPA